MDAIPFNPQDTEYFLGEVLDVLRDPRATYYAQPPAGHVFNPAWPVQSFTFPPSLEIIHCFQFLVDEDGNPVLAPNIITPTQKTRLNMITNPTLEYADMTMPLPLVSLPENRAVVKTADPASSGIFMGAPRWMVVDTTKTPQSPITSPSGGSYADADRKRDNQTAIDVKDIKRALGLR